MPVYMIEHAVPTVAWTLNRTYIEATDQEMANLIWEDLQSDHDFEQDEVIVEHASSGLDDVLETVELTDKEITDEVKNFLSAKSEMITEILKDERYAE